MLIYSIINMSQGKVPEHSLLDGKIINIFSKQQIVARRKFMAFIKKQEIEKAAGKASIEIRKSCIESMRRTISEYLNEVMKKAEQTGKVNFDRMLKVPSILDEFPPEIASELAEAGYELKYNKDEGTYRIA